MSYSKVPKSCVDAPLGIRDVNGIIANQASTKAALDVEHTPPPTQPAVVPTFGDPGGITGVTITSSRDGDGGQHNTAKVARGTLTVDFVDSVAMGDPVMTLNQQSGVTRLISKLATGQYFLPVSGFSNFYVDVTPKATSATPVRTVQQRPTSALDAATTQGSVGIFISTWEEALLDTGVLGFELADYGFSLILYGQIGTAPTFTGQGARPSSIATKPRLWPRFPFPIKRR